MRAPDPHRRTRPPSRRTLLLFALAVILPGFVLAVLGLVTLRQDRRLAEQQLRERRDTLADRAAAALEAELKRWGAALAASSPESTFEPGDLPAPLRSALERSDSTALFAAGRAGAATWPAHRLLYQIPASTERRAPTRTPSRALLAAERIELAERDLTRAAAAYRALLRTSDPTVHADVLVRLARTYRNAGRENLAASVYRDLERLAGTNADGVPVDLLAICALCVAAPDGKVRESCARRIFRDLVQGRWSLDRVWYWAYSEQVRRILDRQAGHDAEIDALAAGEAEKRSLTRAVEAIVEEGAVAGASSTRALSIDGRLFVALTASSADQMRGVVLSTSALSEYVWPVVFSAVLDEAALTLTDVSRTPLFTSGAGELSPTSDPRFATARLVHDAGFTWRIDVRLRHPDALLASFYRRQWLYMAMLAVTVASLVVGTMMTLRTVSRELAVARLKSQFVSAVSHEFRTPLTGIRHYGEMLLHDRVSTEDRKHHYYAQVVAAAERLSRLVEDVLDFARMEEGRQEYRLEPIETTAWLRQAAAEFQAALERDKRLEATIADDLPIVRGDRSALARAIHNLLDNAVKYSPGCDTIWLDAQAVESDLVVAVRDKGIGIPSDEQAHIFERFFRGHGVAASARGTGLGLSIVQHIVSAHGGTIDIESEPGQGTTVTMRLPRERPECAS